MSEEQIKALLDSAVPDRRILSLKTYLLSDYGRSIIERVGGTILEHFERPDLKSLAYTLTKELVMNATKANLKRAVFKEMGLQIDSKNDYDTGMARFKQVLEDGGAAGYRAAFRREDYWTMITYYYDDHVLNIKVKNSFPILPVEEERVKDKMRKARSYTSMAALLAEIDRTEGAGLGLSMICISLTNKGIDNRSFTLKSNEYDETAAKIEIPLKPMPVSVPGPVPREEPDADLIIE